MQPATRSSSQTLGGTRGDWRYRFLFFHVPLALTSALVLGLFMTLPAFDASAYPPGDIRSGTFPQQGGEHGAMDGGPLDMDDEDGRDQAGQMGHGENQAEAMDHGGNRAELMDDGEMGRMMHAAFLGLSMQQLTIGTGYIAVALLGITLLIGPANLLLRKRNPISSYLRRDVGTWTAIFSVVHVIFGFQVHGSLRVNAILNYFIARDDSLLLNSFGLGNWTGLAALVIVVGLLATSSDFVLRKLKAGTWKNLQRLNYALFVLVIAHAFFYGALLRLESPYMLLLVFSVITIFVGQAVGVWLWRRRHARRTVKSA